MSEIKWTTDAEGQDLGWHALNYRTAHTVHAQVMYEELERYVRAAILAERAEVERLRDVLETLAAQSSGVVGSTSRADCMAAMAAAAIRRGSV